MANESKNSTGKKEPPHKIYEEAKSNIGKGDKYNIVTGDITKQDGTVIKRDGTVIKSDGTTISPDIEQLPNKIDIDNVQLPINSNDINESELSDLLEALTQQEHDRFIQQNQLEFDEVMDRIKNDYYGELSKIEEEFGPAKAEPIPEGTVLNNKFRGNKTKPKTQTQRRTERVSNTKKKISGKKLVKPKNMKGKKYRVKGKIDGSSIKQVVASTLVNAATESVEKEMFRLHPDTFADLDNFADLTDDDIKYFADNMFDPSESGELKRQKIKEWRNKRAEAQNNRTKVNQQNIRDNPDDYLNSFIDDYSNRAYGNYSGEQTIGGYKYSDNQYRAKEDFKNPESYTMNEIEFEHNPKTGDIEAMNKTGEKKVVEVEKNKRKLALGEVDDAGDDIFSWMKKHKIGLGEAINVLSTVSSYKDARKKGHSVASSAARAAGSFVMGEMLGFWGSMGWELAKGIPKAAIKGAEVLYKENRKMNAAANQYGLGGDFQDTQQLATMRQSGMEMAKMAQYNLQQTLMGNEATHLHR